MPVEIWQRILESAVFPGPLVPQPEDGFLENILAFQSDCVVISSYYNAECTSTRLRLVCRSWNAFLSSVSNEFTVLPRYWKPEDWPNLQSNLSSAPRIQLVGSFTCICQKPCRYSTKWNTLTSYSGTHPSTSGGFTRIFAHQDQLAAKVLQGGDARDNLEWEWLSKSLPNLRVLSTDFSRYLFFQIQEAFPQLTHLELKHYHAGMFHTGLSIPTLTTLWIHVRRDPRALIQDWSPARTWDLPMLLYLGVEGRFNKSFVETHIQTLLQSTGKHLRGLSVKQTIVPSSPHGFSFPTELWEWCPNLLSLGGTAQSLVRAPICPPSVTLESIVVFGLFGKDNSGDARPESHVRETSHLVAAYARQNVDEFRISITWERWSLRFFEKPLAHRAEWVNFLAQFGLFTKRHGPPLRDVDGASFDGERAFVVRQAVQFEVAVLSERLQTTSWVNSISKH